MGVTGIGDINRFILQFKQRLSGIITKIWCAYINNASICSTYVHFKTLLNPEKYLNIAIQFNIRKSLACFRCPNHKLNIEICRHYCIDKENRICSAILFINKTI